MAVLVSRRIGEQADCKLHKQVLRNEDPIAGTSRKSGTSGFLISYNYISRRLGFTSLGLLCLFKGEGIALPTSFGQDILVMAVISYYP